MSDQTVPSCLKPMPDPKKNPGARAWLVKKFAGLVDDVTEIVKMPEADYAGVFKKWTARAKHYKDAAKALEALLADLQADPHKDQEQCASISLQLDAFRNHADSWEARAERYKPRKGRPVDWKKIMCFQDCSEFLHRHKLEPSVASLAREVWERVTGEIHSLDVWEQVGKRQAVQAPKKNS